MNQLTTVQLLADVPDDVLPKLCKLQVLIFFEVSYGSVKRTLERSALEFNVWMYRTILFLGHN